MYTIRMNKSWYLYNGKTWVRPDDEVVEGIIAKIAAKNDLSYSQTNQTIHTLKRISAEDGFNESRNVLVFENGVIDLSGWESGQVDLTLHRHSKKWRKVGTLGYDYDPDANCIRFKLWLNTVTNGDLELIMLMQEIAGYMLIDGNPHQK
ncbi:hypothetical protein RZS08_20010, partial [Arthrospira platensis SPKY1]|nr:hypothetical protein [Arthrospira platensis SPKY1]